MNCACSSGDSFTIPLVSSWSSVAKMRPLTRKSGWFMCELSTAPSIPNAMRRKSFPFIEAP
jgi:hypothetical protein